MPKLFIFVITLVLFLSFIPGCGSMTCAEREAHYVNARRYIPMLKTYIKADKSLHDNLKSTYVLALNEWWNLTDAKYKECMGETYEDPKLKDEKSEVKEEPNKEFDATSKEEDYIPLPQNIPEKQ